MRYSLGNGNIQFFGGRGQSIYPRPSTPGSKAKWSSKNGVGDQVPNSLREALGTKGKPMSMVDAYWGANPYYSDNYKEFSENCQRCVFANEMRRRGYDVEAQPTYKGDEIPVAGNWKKAMKGMTQANVGSTKRGENGVNETIDNIKSQMAKWGNGSRAIIRIKWDSKHGHVINCEYQNGVLHVYDAQSNKRETNTSYLKSYLPYAVRSATELYRVDNAKITKDMKYMVRAKKKK